MQRPVAIPSEVRNLTFSKSKTKVVLSHKPASE
jgi:hypothetical protein